MLLKVEEHGLRVVDDMTVGLALGDSSETRMREEDGCAVTIPLGFAGAESKPSLRQIYLPTEQNLATCRQNLKNAAEGRVVVKPVMLAVLSPSYTWRQGYARKKKVGIMRDKGALLIWRDFCRVSLTRSFGPGLVSSRVPFGQKDGSYEEDAIMGPLRRDEVGVTSYEVFPGPSDLLFGH